MWVKQGFSVMGIWQCLETFLVVTVGAVLLASGRSRPRMLLTSYHTQDIFATKNDPASHVQS